MKSLIRFTVPSIQINKNEAAVCNFRKYCSTLNESITSEKQLLNLLSVYLSILIPKAA